MIPPDANAGFVAAMEDVLETYQKPRDPDRPLVCLDESSKQLIVETRAPIPARPGRAVRHDYEYERNGVANIFMIFAPLEGWRCVKVTDRHAAADYAQVLKDSPLARLRMAIELWLAKPSPDLLAEIKRNLTESDELVDEILLASRLDYGSSTSPPGALVDLTAVAAEEAARFEPSVASLAEGGQPIEIEGEATLLRRLIRNLLENAVKHGRPPVRIAVTRIENTARVTVSDCGEGIAPAERERVFEPFYRPAGRSESSGGWGLGLSLVRQIAERHGGSVVCEAEPGGGSRFVVDLAVSIRPDQPNGSCQFTLLSKTPSFARRRRATSRARTC